MGVLEEPSTVQKRSRIPLQRECRAEKLLNLPASPTINTYCHHNLHLRRFYQLCQQVVTNLQKLQHTRYRGPLIFCPVPIPGGGNWAHYLECWLPWPFPPHHLFILAWGGWECLLPSSCGRLILVAAESGPADAAYDQRQLLSGWSSVQAAARLHPGGGGAHPHRVGQEAGEMWPWHRSCLGAAAETHVWLCVCVCVFLRS